MIDATDGDFRWAKPSGAPVANVPVSHRPDARLAILAAVEVDRALSNPDDRPTPPSAEAIARLDELETVVRPAARGLIDSLESAATILHTEFERQREHRGHIVEGYRRIDDAIDQSVAADLSSRRRGGQRSVHDIALAERDRLAVELGFASYAAYARARDTAIRAEDDLVASISARDEIAQRDLMMARNRVHGPLHAEIELLSFHVRFDTHVDVSRSVSQRDRNLTRRLLRSPLSTVLRSMSIDPGDDAVATGARWLDTL